MGWHLLVLAVLAFPAAEQALAVEPPAAPANPAANTEKAPGPSDAAFFAELGYKDTATAADASRALAILVSEGSQVGDDFETAKAYLAKRGVLAGGWFAKAAADAPVSRGHLAVLICKTLGIKGGIWMRMFGPNPRLALNECAYLEVMVRGCDYGYVTGGELVGVIDRADRLRSKGTQHAVPELEGHTSEATEAEQ